MVALPACDRAVALLSARPSAAAGATVRVSHDSYGDHVGPSLAANPRHNGQLLVACQGSPRPPEFIPTYVSFDGGASWRPGGRPPQPATGPAGDDVNIAFDAHGRGYICATRSGHGVSVNSVNPDANRGVYVWRTDDGGRSFSEPVTLANSRINEVLLVSRPHELRFRPPTRVTTAPFNPLDSTTAFRGKYGAWWIGDWQGIAASDGAFHLVWNDTRTGKLDLFAAAVRL